jgi:hypothetical protein
MLDLTGTNTKGQGSKGTVRRSVRVTAHSDTSRKSETLLGTDNVNDTLTFVGHGKVCHTEILDILLELHDLRSTSSLFNECFYIHKIGSVSGGYVVIDGHKSAVRSPHGAVSNPEAFKGLRGRHLVNQMAIDVDESRQAVIIDQVIIPDLVNKSSFGKQRRRGLESVPVTSGNKS